MNTQVLAVLGPVLLLGFRLLADFVPMYPLNDLTKKTGKSRIRDLTLHYVPLTAIAMALLSDSGFIRPLGLLLAIGYLAGHVWVWWIPYAAGSPEALKEKRERPYLRTHRILPQVGDHLVPDTAHVIAALLAVLMVMGSAALTFQGKVDGVKPAVKSAEAQPPQQQTVESAFTQGGEHPEKLLADTLLSAKSTLDIAIYAINHDGIVDAILQTAAKGVQVRVITDRTESASPAQADKLKKLVEAGIPVKENTRKGLMHLKLAIIDDLTVTTGSFNYTANAATLNDEVLLVVRDAKTAAKWKAQFDAMWKDTQNYRELKTGATPKK